MNNKGFTLLKLMLKLSEIYILLLFTVFIAIAEYAFYIYYVKGK